MQLLSPPNSSTLNKMKNYSASNWPQTYVPGSRKYFTLQHYIDWCGVQYVLCMLISQSQIRMIMLCTCPSVSDPRIFSPDNWFLLSWSEWEHGQCCALNMNVMNLSDSNNMQENLTQANYLNSVRLSDRVDILTGIENVHCIHHVLMICVTKHWSSSANNMLELLITSTHVRPVRGN